MTVTFRFVAKVGDDVQLIDPAVVHQQCPWMLYALQERGQEAVEKAGNNPRIVEYLNTLSMAALYNPGAQWQSDETNWCAAFVNWCLEQAGYAGTKMGLARSFLHWPAGTTIEKPKFGCVTVFERGQSPSGHVGFFLKFNDDGSKIFLLGGNQSRKVKVSQYLTSSVLGYLWPRKLGT